jgi:hypothetical protein
VPNYSEGIGIGMLGQTAGGVLLPRLVDTLAMPLDTWISAQREVSQYTSSQQAWEANPLILPPPDALFDLLVRGMLDGQRNGGQRIVWGALRAHGIDVWPPAGRFKAVDQRRQLWGAVQALKYKLPDHMWLLDAHRKGLLPDGWDIHARLKRRTASGWKGLPGVKEAGTDLNMFGIRPLVATRAS